LQGRVCASYRRLPHGIPRSN